MLFSRLMLSKRHKNLNKIHFYCVLVMASYVCSDYFLLKKGIWCSLAKMMGYGLDFLYPSWLTALPKHVVPHSELCRYSINMVNIHTHKKHSQILNKKLKHDSQIIAFKSKPVVICMIYTVLIVSGQKASFKL